MIKWELRGREEIINGPVTVVLSVQDARASARPVVTGAENSSYLAVAELIENASDPIGHPVGRELSGEELVNVFKCNRVFERYAIALVEGAEFIGDGAEVGLSAEAEATGLRS